MLILLSWPFTTGDDPDFGVWIPQGEGSFYNERLIRISDVHLKPLGDSYEVLFMRGYPTYKGKVIPASLLQQELIKTPDEAVNYKQVCSTYKDRVKDRFDDTDVYLQGITDHTILNKLSAYIAETQMADAKN